MNHSVWNLTGNDYGKFSEEIIQQVWEKGVVVDGFDKDYHRKDAAGAWIGRTSYGNREGIYGWDIDHVYPVSKGGDSNILNLRPMHCRNIERKDDDYPVYYVAVKAHDVENVEVHETARVNDKLQAMLNDLYKIDSKKQQS